MSKSITLAVRGLSKVYGTFTALAPVDVDFYSGEVHAVLGENGAGKSTFMNCVAGFVRPAGGSVSLSGEPLALGDPLAIRARGVAMVHQHFMLVPTFSVAENLALARLGHLNGRLSLDDLTARAVELGKSLGWPVDLGASTESLPVGVQQRLEILKVLVEDASVLIFDEPTAVLTPDEVEDLFRVISSLRGQGKTILLIAHKLSEVMQIADRVTVLRGGKWVATRALGETNEDEIAAWMIGEVPPLRTPSSDQVFGEILIDAEEFFSVRSGEILGIGGVDGNGQVELAEALAGVRPFEGTLRVEGGTGYIPQDRHQDGLALEMSLIDNFMITGHRDPNLRYSPRRIRAWAERLIAQYQIKAQGAKALARSLSGGNQQKVVVSRVLASQPKVIVAVNPTRGLDFGAADFVLGQLKSAAAAGAAVVLFSTDRDELAACAHRVLYMSQGQVYDDIRALTGSLP